jgi:hypothetical protein
MMHYDEFNFTLIDPLTYFSFYFIIEDGHKNDDSHSKIKLEIIEEVNEGSER